MADEVSFVCHDPDINFGLSLELLLWNSLGRGSQVFVRFGDVKFLGVLL